MKKEIVINNVEQLKDPVVVYSVMTLWMREAGEDLIDYNCSLIKGREILDWILDKGYTTKDKYDEILIKKETHIQTLLLGYEEGLLNYGECTFPSVNKAYQVMAEFISEKEELRNEFFYSYCTSFDDEKGDESRCGMCASYDREDGIPICCHILDYDMESNTKTWDEWMDEKWDCDISFADEYNYLKVMSFEEVDAWSEKVDMD